MYYNNIYNYNITITFIIIILIILILLIIIYNNYNNSTYSKNEFFKNKCSDYFFKKRELKKKSKNN